MTSMRSKSWVVAAVASTLAIACVDDGPYEIEVGTYEVTAAHSQDSTEAWEVDGLRFTIAETSDGIAMDSPTSVVPDVSEVKRVGDHYYAEKFSASVRRCEAGPNSFCQYDFASTTVSVPGPGRVRIESCHHADAGACSSPSPSCGDAVQHFAGMTTCTQPRLVVGKLLAE
jgi:hypothetical protein